MRRPFLLAFALTALTALTALPAPAGAGAQTPEAEVAKAIDAYHAAAARADEEAYFALMAPTGVFLGTDATERWGKDAFRAFAHPYFAKGKAWTFAPRDRHVGLSASGQVAWFDELLDSATYGECRGSGVLEKIDGVWKIQQYNLSIPMPNDLSKELVARIQAAKAKK
jgi:ketosteroid isomerase-like protein